MRVRGAAPLAALVVLALAGACRRQAAAPPRVRSDAGLPAVGSVTPGAPLGPPAAPPAASPTSAPGSLPASRAATQPASAPASMAAGPLEGEEEPIVLDPDKPLATGCFGWSPATATAACVTGGHSMQQGGEYKVEFVGGTGQVAIVRWDGFQDGDVPLKLLAARARELGHRLAAERFTGLDVEWRPLAPRRAVTFTIPRVTVRWLRERTRQEARPTGTYTEYADRIVLDCDGRGRTVRDILKSDSSSDARIEARAALLPGGRHVLVERDSRACGEGGCTSDTSAGLADLAGCAADAGMPVPAK